MTQLTPEQINLLSVLVALNEWEHKNLSSLQAPEGRAHYFQMAESLLSVQGQGGFDPWLGQNVPLATTAFGEALDKHLLHFQDLLAHRFVLIEK